MKKRFLALFVAAAMLMGVLAASVTVQASSADRFTIEETDYGWTRVINGGGVTLGFAADGEMELLIIDGWAFKDMNGNGELDVYEDWRLDQNTRAADLAARLSPEQIAGLMIYSGHQFGVTEALTGDQMALLDMGVRAVLTAAQGSPVRDQVLWANAMQAYAEYTCSLSIPINFSTDPRNTNISRWPENLALAATFDPDIAFQAAMHLSAEFRALGIQTYLGPMIDLASDPRWFRATGSFGEDPALSRDLTKATILGFQSTFGDDGSDLGWGETSVNAMMKHWFADGSGEGGRMSNEEWGAFSVFPGGQIETHLIPFVDGGLDNVGETEMVTGVMAAFTIAYSEDGRYGELVGTAFCEQRIQLLRDFGFDGVVCTDWFAIGSPFRDTGWGVMDLEADERVYMALMAGTDQFGGLNEVEPVLAAFELLSERHGEEFARARIEDSARRLTRNYFLVGAFDNPYLDLSASLAIVENSEAVAAGERAMQQSIIMLKNDGVIGEGWAGERPLVYVPLRFTHGMADWFGGFSPSLIDLPIPYATLARYFDIITDTIGEATGPDGNYVYEDIVRATAEELADIDFALIFSRGPVNGTPGMMTHLTGRNHETGDIIPLSLQFRPYRALSDYVRDPSLAGHIVTTETAGTYGTQITVTQENRSYFGQRAQVSNEFELDAILHVAETVPEGVPVIVSMVALRPFVAAEFEEYVDVLLVGFDVANEVFLDIVMGNAEPTGLLPMQMPLDMIAVERQFEDVPRDMEVFVDSMGNAYDFGFGLNWSGVISDWRTERFVVPPLVSPERQPVHRPEGITR